MSKWRKIKFEGDIASVAQANNWFIGLKAKKKKTLEFPNPDEGGNCITLAITC